MNKIVRWNVSGGVGFIRINGQDVFLHVTAVMPRQSRGVDLNGREVEVHQISDGEKGSKVVSATLVPTAEERERAKAAEESLARQRAALEAARAEERAALEAAKAQEEALRNKLGPATILVAHQPHPAYERDVRVDGKKVGKRKMTGAL